MNLKSISNWKTGILSLIGVLLASVSLNAQAPRYVPPPPPTKHITFEVRMRYLFQPNISFRGLGAIPLRDSYETSNSMVDGTERTILYDDGYIDQDYIPTELIENSTGIEYIPSDITEGSSSFMYVNPDQVDRDLDPTTLMFHRYATQMDPSVEFEGSGSGSLGWELNYTKYINRRRNLGIQVGFSFNGFDSRFHDSIEADLYTQTFKHQMVDGDVPELTEVEDDDGNITYLPYQGDKVHDPESENTLLEWMTSEEMSEEILEGGATVDTRADLRSSVYNFRAGPTYQVALGRLFAFQMGAGVSAQFVNGRFSTFEILNNTSAIEAPRRPMMTTEEAEWQVGGYFDATAHYNFTERVSLFSGMQVQSGSTYTQSNEDRFAEVDFSSQVYVHAGFGVKF